MKKVLAILLCLTMVAGLTACKKKADTEEAVSDNEEEILEFDTEYGAYSEGAEWGNNYEGSAVYLEGKTAVVTISVSTKEDPFKSSDIKKMKKNLKTALDYISETAKNYGKNAEFVFDEKDLEVEINDFEGNLELFEGEDYDGMLEDILANQIDPKAIREKYSADGIAYVFFLNGTGDCFATPHWIEDEVYFTSEGAFIYKNTYDEDYEETATGPDVYMYQFLQLFGAIPLDFPDATYGYTVDLYNIVEENFSDDIMYSFYTEDGAVSKSISRKITDITAYTVGLTDSFEGLVAGDPFEREYPCAISDDFMTNTNDGSDMTEYDFDFDFDFDDQESN